jgi:ABC-type transporter Mla MlaB component
MPNAAAAKTLTFSVEEKGTAANVRCRGQLVAGVGSEFAAKIRTLIPGHKRIILDLTNLTRVDSMGLGTLVSLYVSAKSGGVVPGADQSGQAGARAAGDYTSARALRRHVRKGHRNQAVRNARPAR